MASAAAVPAVGEAAVPRSAMDRAIQSFRTGLFGVLFVMAKDASMHRLYALFMMVLDWLQMMSFPLSQSAALPWHASSVISSISSALSVLSVGRAISFMGPGMTLASFYFALFWIFGLLGCAVWVGSSFARESFRVLWPIKLLRTTAQLSTTALFIPLVSVLTNIYRCPPGTTWASTGWQCWDGSHAVVAVLVAILIALFAGLSAIVVSVFFDRNPQSASPTARPHGRVQVAMILCKAALTIVYTQDWWLSSWVLAAFSILAGSLWVFSYAAYLPFYRQWVNQMQSALGSVHLWAGICLALVLIAGIAHVDSAAYAFICGAPFVAFAGWVFNDMRWRSLDKADDMSSPYAIELKGRRLLSRIQGDAGPGQPTGRGAVKVHPMPAEGIAAAGAEPGDDDNLETLQEVEELYKDGCELLPASSMVRVFAAQFFAIYRGNRHLEVQMLAAAEHRTPSPDEAFIIFQRRRQVQDSDESGTGAKMNVIARVRFEKYRVESQEFGLKGREKQVEFWTELLHKQPDIGRLNAVAGEITESTVRADVAYRHLLRINSRSVQTLRSYAQFLLEVTNNPAKANRLLEEADTIEDEASKAHAERGSSVVFLSDDVPLNASSENIAVITLSQDAANVGEMLTANPQALKLFGYTRREMVGRNITTLLPEPIASFHDRVLRAYLASGEPAIINSSRVMFGVHRAGHIFPVLLNVRSMDTGFGGLMQPIPSDERFLFFMSKSLRVTAACQESLLLMGLSPDDLKSRSVKVDRFFAGIQDAVEEQSVAQGLTAAAAAVRTGDEDAIRRASDAAKLKTKHATGVNAPRFKIELKRVSKGYLGHMGIGGKSGAGGRGSIAARRPSLFAQCQLQVTPVTASYRRFDTVNENDGEGSMRGYSRNRFEGDFCVVLRWRRHIDEAGSTSSKDRGGAAKRNALASVSEAVDGGGETSAAEDAKPAPGPGGIARLPHRDMSEGEEEGRARRMSVAFSSGVIRRQDEKEGQASKGSEGHSEAAGVGGGRKGSKDDEDDEDDEDDGEDGAEGKKGWFGWRGRRASQGSEGDDEEAAGARKGRVDDGEDDEDDDGRPRRRQPPSPKPRRKSSKKGLGPAKPSLLGLGVPRVEEEGSSSDGGSNDGGRRGGGKGKRRSSSRRRGRDSTSEDDDEDDRKGRKRRSSRRKSRSGGRKRDDGSDEAEDDEPDQKSAPRRKPAVSRKTKGRRDESDSEEDDRRGGRKSKKGTVSVRVTDAEADARRKGDGELKGRSATDDSGSEHGSSVGGSSHGGGSSMGSSSSRASAMTQLRRSLAWQSVHIEPGLWRLRQAVFYIFAIIAVVNIATTIVSREVLNGYLYDLVQVRESGQRLIDFEHINLGVQTMHLMGSGRIPATDGQFNLTRAVVANSVKKFAAVHDKLYVAAASSGYQALTDLYSGVVPPFIQLTPAPASGTSATSEVTRVGLLDAGKKVVTKATTAYKMPRTEWAKTLANSSDVHFLLTNGPFAIQDALNASTWLSQFRTNTVFSSMSQVRWVMMWSTCGLITLMGLLVVVPITRQVEAGKDDIFKVFLEVPTVVLRALKAQASKRLTKLLRDMEDDDAGLSDDEDASESDAITNVDWSKIDLKLRKRRYRKGLTVFCRLLARFLLPLAAVLGYYVGVFLWDDSTANTVLHDGEGILHAAIRTTQLARTEYFATSFMAERNTSVAGGSVFLAKQAMEAFSRLQRDLLYGNANAHLRMFLVISERQRRLMLENGCIGLGEPSDADQLAIMAKLQDEIEGLRLSPALSELAVGEGTHFMTPLDLHRRSECDKYRYEVMKGGLHQGVIQFLSAADELIREREAELARFRAAGITFEPDASADRRLADVRLKVLRTLGFAYVGAGMIQSIDYHYQDVVTIITEFQLYHALVTAASVAALVVFYLVVYAPAIAQLDVEMKRTRQMLLLFPEHIIRSVPAIRGMVAQFSQGGAGHVMRSTSSSNSIG